MHLVPCYLFCKESPCWLRSQGRVEEAAKVLNEMAEMNGSDLRVTESRVQSDVMKAHEPGAYRALWAVW